VLQRQPLPSRGLPDARLRLLVDDETFPMATAHRAHQVPPAASFVWSEIGLDAGETPEHIIVRKEAESGSQELENSGGALVRRLELAWRLWHSGMVAPCPHFSRSPRASKRNRTVKYGSGMLGEAYFTPISKDVFRVI
jgi:hypothetical protein